MEFSAYSKQAQFWREVYLTAMQDSRVDRPVNVADEALMEFMSRFPAEEQQGVNEAQGSTTAGFGWIPLHGAAVQAERQQAIQGGGGMQFFDLDEYSKAAGEQLTLRDPAPLGEGPSIEVGDVPADTESDDLG